MTKPKHGFNVPTDPWFRGPLKNFMQDVLMSGQLKSRDYLNLREVNQMAQRHIDGHQVLDTHLWMVINFELWYQTFMETPMGILQ